MAARSISFMSIIALKARLASAPTAAMASVRTRGVICQLTPHLSLHRPQTLFFPPLPNGVPVAVGLFLIFHCYLKGEGFAVLEHGAVIEADHPRQALQLTLH
jgi:hypothetical protein